MAQYRREMLESEMKKLITQGFSQLKDPRLKDKFIDINMVRLSKDKSYLDVYVSSLDEDVDAIIEILNDAKGMFRTLIAKNIKMFKAPEVRFHKDEGIEASIRINKLIEKIEKNEESK
ncbi:ribosome-binding factor A [Petrotoga sp. 9T1HF07.CasAA.8.2]|uniref:30S ribosome-binding factor RbfA n=1 Tax=Petrotoga sp. 9T1HF07.CasAA.8.2 TaxID=1434329 RepID=UPI000CC4F22F|nr:30S ribosome-binding factor RbfA [Petrotoga sp. 9T1HF07.CasAA.8.2]PNR87702.1 ribosome-binding factor A [Petrotoga sp. 9T1HF07.CasAA.8.2]